MNSAMSSDVQSAHSLCSHWGSSANRFREQSREKEKKSEKARPQGSTCYPFIGAFTHEQSTSWYVQFVPGVLAT